MLGMRSAVDRVERRDAGKIGVPSGPRIAPEVGERRLDDQVEILSEIVHA